jgi:hypothetical protein
LCDGSVAHVEITHDSGGSKLTYYSFILAMAFASVNSLVLALSWLFLGFWCFPWLFVLNIVRLEPRGQFWKSNWLDRFV